MAETSRPAHTTAPAPRTKMKVAVTQKPGTTCKRVPVVMQMEATECGAASLAMVLAYYGLRVPLDQLRDDCGVSRDGAKASSIARAAQKHGMEVHIYKYKIKSLQTKVTYPAIIHWNFSHFVVLQGFERGQALINDPARGRVKVSMEEFDRSYTGIVITIVPTDKFVPGGKPSSVWKFVSSRLHGSKAAILLLMLTGLLAAVSAPLVPAFARVFTDDILSAGARDMLAPLVVAMLATAVFVLVAGVIHASTTYRVQGKLAVSANASFLWHVLHLPMRFFAQRRPGDLANRQSLNDTVAQTLVEHLAPLLNEAVLLVVYLFIMFRYSVGLSLIGIGAIVATGLVGAWISNLTMEAQRRQMHEMSLVSNATYMGIDMIETIKVSGAENGYFEQWAGYAASAQRAQVEQVDGTRFLVGVPALINSLSGAAVLLVGAKLIMDGHLTAGMLTAFQGVLRQFMQPATALVSATQALIEMRASMERIEDVMKYQKQPEGPTTLEDDVCYEKLTGAIDIRHLTFGYSPLEPPLLNDFSLTIRPGDKIALVGMSGCGKSTIAKLVGGLYEPWSGEILYDGMRRLDIPKEVFCGSLMVVDQDSYLFEDTVYDNIKLWDETISNGSAIQAAKDAQIHEDIMARPGGYDHRMREGAKDFSGGQRQRMEIARVLSGEPTIAIFDEATSALDARTEFDLTRAVAERGITTIVIAHRLSTIRDADLILVMDRGRVVQRGTHEELFEQDGLYRQLISNE